MKLPTLFCKAMAICLIGCMETDDNTEPAKIDYELLYDIRGREIDAPWACRSAVVALRNQVALDGFIAAWTVKDDALKLPGFDFASRQVLGIVTQRNTQAPVTMKVASFVEYPDSIKLELKTGCDRCIQDTPSGDALILAYGKTGKPLSISINGVPKALDDSVRKFEVIPDCTTED